MVDTFNKYIVGRHGKDVVIVNRPTGPMSPDDAMNLAAWLVSVAEHDASETFEEIFNAVQNT